MDFPVSRVAGNQAQRCQVLLGSSRPRLRSPATLPQQSRSLAALVHCRSAGARAHGRLVPVISCRHGKHRQPMPPPAALLAGSGGTEEEAAAGAVLTLDSGNFAEVVKAHQFIVNDFYDTWCGPCKRLAPEDATSNDIPPYFNVEGYPTMYF